MCLGFNFFLEGLSVYRASKRGRENRLRHAEIDSGGFYFNFYNYYYIIFLLLETKQPRTAMATSAN